MNWRRKWWLVVLVLALVLAAGGAIGRALHRSASLAFLEFRKLGNERCAVFLLRNEGSQALLFADSYWASNEHGRSEPDVVYMVRETRCWPSYPGVFIKAFVRRLEPGQSREGYAPATFTSGNESPRPLTEPFRAGVKLQPDLMWVHQLGSFIGWNAGDYVLNQQRKRQFEIWSDPVAP